MRKIRVLIVDDSTVIRRLLSDALNSDSELEVAATAANGRIALAKIPQVNPDVITLDMEMPEMDGIATLVELRKTYSRLPVIMFSTLTQRGAESTLDALAKGANDYVTKPANVGSVTAALQSVRSQLIPKIKGFTPWRQLAPDTVPDIKRAVAARHLLSSERKATRIDLVAIGTSTGGPNALVNVLSKLPATLSVPVVVVQHMPPIFTKHMADRLNQISPLNVKEAAIGDMLQPGGVWIAPGDFHMVVERHAHGARLNMHQGPPENSCRPAVDVLFRSAAGVYGPGVLAVVMTGMGKDGLRGCGAIRDAGGRVLIQDEASSVVWGMPGVVAQAGLADRIAPLDRLAGEVLRETQYGRNAHHLETAGI